MTRCSRTKAQLLEDVATLRTRVAQLEVNHPRPNSSLLSNAPIPFYQTLADRTGAALQVWRLGILNDLKSLTLAAQSRAAQKIVPIAPSQAIAETMSRVCPELFETEFPFLLAQVICTGRKQLRLSVRCKRPGHANDQLHFSAFPMPDRCVGVLLRSAPAREPSGSLFHRLLEFSPEAMIIIDAQDLCLEVNRAACAMLGKSRKRLLGTRVDKLPIREGSPPKRDRDSRKTSRPPTGRGSRLSRPNGRQPNIEFVQLCSFRSLRLVVIRRAISPAAVDRAQQWHARVFDNLYDAVVVIDMKGGITDWNAGAERTFGYSRAEMLGKSPDTIYHDPRDSIFGPQNLRKLMRMDGWSGELACLRKDGAERLCEAVAVPVLDEGQKLIEILIVFRDVTERQRAERRAHRKEAEFAHLARLNTMADMASAIAHQLNQPLTAVVSGAQACARLLRANPDNREMLIEALGDVAEEGRRAGDIVRHLRDFICKQEPEPASADVRDLIGDAIELTRGEVLRASVRIRLQCQD